VNNTPSEPAATHPAPAESATPPAASAAVPGPSRRTTAIGGVVIVAIVGAIATAIITPGRLDQLIGMFVSPAAPTSIDAPLRYKTITSPDGAIALEVPATWVMSGASWNSPIDGVLDTGTAVFSGPEITSRITHGKDAVYIGASASAANRLQFESASGAELSSWLRAQADEPDWSLDNCVLSSDAVPPIRDWIVEARVWKGCGSLDGVRLWEAYAVDPSGRFVAVIQIELAPGTSDDVARHIVGSLVVVEKKLPRDAPVHADLP